MTAIKNETKSESGKTKLSKERNTFKNSYKENYEINQENKWQTNRGDNFKCQPLLGYLMRKSVFFKHLELNMSYRTKVMMN